MSKSLIAALCAGLALSGPAWAQSTPSAPAPAAPATAEPAPNAQGPLEMTRSVAEDTLRDIRNNRSTYEQDSEALYAMVDKRILALFDFETMSLLVLGPNWKKASEEQQQRFVSAFKNLLVRTYSKALLQAGDEQINWQPLDLPAGATRTVVQASVDTDGKPIDISWRLREIEAGWRVYDVVVDGVSLVTNYRGSYNCEIRKIGLDGLIEKIEQTSAKAAAANAPSRPS